MSKARDAAAMARLDRLYLFEHETHRDTADDTHQASAYHRQGRPSLHTPALLAARERVRHSRRLRDAALAFWHTIGKAESETLDKDEYTRVHHLIVRALAPELSAAEAAASADDDWLEDLQGASEMTCERYIDGLCAIADLWTDQVKEDDYVAFLQNLYRRVTVAWHNGLLAHHAAAKGVRLRKRRVFRDPKDVLPVGGAVSPSRAQKTERERKRAAPHPAAPADEVREVETLRTPRGAAPSGPRGGGAGEIRTSVPSGDLSLDMVLEGAMDERAHVGLESEQRRVSYSLKMRASSGWMEDEAVPSSLHGRRASRTVHLGQLNRQRVSMLGPRLPQLRGIGEAGEDEFGQAVAGTLARISFAKWPTRESLAARAAGGVPEVAATASNAQATMGATVSAAPPSTTRAEPDEVPSGMRSLLSMRTSIAHVDVLSKLSLAQRGSTRREPDEEGEVRGQRLRTSQSAPSLQGAAQPIRFRGSRVEEAAAAGRRRELLLNVFQAPLASPVAEAPRARVRRAASALAEQGAPEPHEAPTAYASARELLADIVAGKAPRTVGVEKVRGGGRLPVKREAREFGEPRGPRAAVPGVAVHKLPGLSTRAKAAAAARPEGRVVPTRAGRPRGRMVSAHLDLS